MTTILILAANPTDTRPLRIDEEVRTIEESVRLADFGHTFTIKGELAVRTSDLQDRLLRHKPDIIHFSGHGTRSDGIVLEDKMGNAKLVSARALGGLFATLADNVRCVVLNACYSQDQADVIATHIDCVIGMSHSISDQSAITFASSFYRALAYGRSVNTAFELGCGQVDLDDLGEHRIPQMICRRADPSRMLFAGVSPKGSPSTASSTGLPAAAQQPAPGKTVYCSVCGVTAGRSKPCLNEGIHIFRTAAPDSFAFCSVCGVLPTDSPVECSSGLPHIFQVAKSGTAVYCSVCGATPATSPTTCKDSYPHIFKRA